MCSLNLSTSSCLDRHAAQEKRPVLVEEITWMLLGLTPAKVCLENPQENGKTLGEPIGKWENLQKTMKNGGLPSGTVNVYITVENHYV